MALQISYTDKTGVEHSSAYARVAQMEWDLDESLCTINVHFYHNEAARSKDDNDARKEPVFIRKYYLTSSIFVPLLVDSILITEDKSPLSQIYAWLKTHNDSILSGDALDSNLGQEINWTTATDV